MKKLFFIFVLLVNFSIKAQENCYFVMPKQFSFQKKQDQYRINSLSKHILQNQGHKVVWSDELSKELGINQKNIINVDLQNNSNLFTTKVKFIFKDSSNKEIFTTLEGKSREKDFTKAFNEAIKISLEDFKNNFKHKCSNQNELKQSTSTLQNKIEISAENIKELKAVYVNEDIYLFENGQKLFLLEKTPIQNTFKATDKDQNKGIFYKKDDLYIFEYKQNDNIISSYFKIIWEN